MFLPAYLVVLVSTFIGFVELANLTQNVASIENTLDTLAHNFSVLRKDMVTAEVLNLYLSQEAAFRNTLQQQLDGLSRNMTKLTNQHEQDQHIIQKLQGDRDALREEVTILKHNNSVLKLLYEDDLQQLDALKSAQSNLQQELKQMSLALVDNMAEIAQVNGSISNELSQLSFSMQQDRNDVASINKTLSALLQKEVISLRQQFSSNITSVQSKLAQYIESGEQSYFVEIKIELSALLCNHLYKFVKWRLTSGMIY